MIHLFIIEVIVGGLIGVSVGNYAARRGWPFSKAAILTLVLFAPVWILFRFLNS